MIFMKISHRGDRSILIFICSIFIAGLLTLLGLECYLRTSTTPNLTPGYKRSHSERIYELVPNYDGKTYDAVLKFNSLGIRDYERPILKDAYRIAIFGDSITFGQGVELKNTFAKILERQLNEHYKTNPKIQIFNFGVPGYNTLSEYLYLKDSYQKYKPDLVILQYTAEDDSISSHQNQYKFISFIKDIAQQLYIYQLFVSKVYNIIDYSSTADNNIYSDDYEGWLETQKTFKNIKQFAEENNFELLFALYVNNFKDTIVKKIKNAVKNAEIDNVVLIDDFLHDVKAKEQQLLWLKSDDHHFSKLSHQLTAKGIYQYIINKEIINQNHGKNLNSISD